jgi:nicotinate phosphoribosyltransferase
MVSFSIRRPDMMVRKLFVHVSPDIWNMGRFATVDDETIRKGDCTDIYFVRTEEVLRASGKNPQVALEVTTGELSQAWGIFCGLDDVLSLLEGHPISVDALPEGAVFYPGEPVLRIEGAYTDFARYETAILGFLCHASGIATAAAHIKQQAGGKMVYSFGSRRQHPAIARMVERAAWIGGVDGVSNTSAPEGVPLVGTMPHSFVMCYTTVDEAFSAFDRFSPPGVPRIYLSDTWCDEKRESLTAARCGAAGVRLDTPRSRRGDMRAILEEVRWELDSAGYPGVRIVLSGGVRQEDIILYRDLVDAFGVGGAIANAPVIDFAMDIVTIDGQRCAKRGKKSGRKQVWEMPDMTHTVLPDRDPGPPGSFPLLEPYIRDGVVLKRPSLADARERAGSYLKRLES